MQLQMTVGKKFGLACATLVLLTIAMGVFSLYSIGAVQTNGVAGRGDHRQLTPCPAGMRWASWTLLCRS